LRKPQVKPYNLGNQKITLNKMIKVLQSKLWLLPVFIVALQKPLLARQKKDAPKTYVSGTRETHNNNQTILDSILNKSESKKKSQRKTGGTNE